MSIFILNSRWHRKSEQKWKRDRLIWQDVRWLVNVMIESSPSVTFSSPPLIDSIWHVTYIYHRYSTISIYIWFVSIITVRWQVRNSFSSRCREKDIHFRSRLIEFLWNHISLFSVAIICKDISIMQLYYPLSFLSYAPFLDRTEIYIKYQEIVENLIKRFYSRKYLGLKCAF